MILEAERITRDGLNPTFHAADVGGDEFVNCGIEFLHIRNDSGATTTITFVTQGTVDGQPVADRTMEIPAGELRVVGTFPVATYNDDAGNVQLTYSSVTDLSLAVMRT